MPHPKRSLVIKVASAVSALAMVAGVAGVAITHSTHTAAASPSFHATRAHLTAKSTSLHFSQGHLTGVKGTTQAATRANTTKTKTISRKEFFVSKQAAPKTNARAPRLNVGSAPLTSVVSGKTPLTNINGLSELDNDALIGGEVTPPDQGLCSVTTSDGTIVFEMTNMAIAAMDPSGTIGFETSLADWFGDPYAYGDPRCVYDAASQTTYFTELSLEGFYDSSNAFGADLLAVNFNTDTVSEYYIDWSDTDNNGCPCLGDQMRIGYDANGIYLTADEFPLYGAGNYGYGYNGSEMIALSKADVLGDNPTPASWYYNNIAVNGIPVLGLMPAQSESHAGSEWLANTFPFDIAGNNNSVSNQVALWRVTGDGDIQNNPPTMTYTLATTEQYAFPVTAVSTTGPDGSTSVNVNDDRIGQIEFMGNHLYTTVSTAVNVKNDANTYDGVAWFDFDTVSKKVSHQGYLAFKGDYLTYPSIIRTHAGKSYINYSISNSTLNPSAAFSSRPTDTYPFNNPQIAGYGSSAHYSYTYRWGDYSASAIDPNGTTVWMANEYIPPLADQGYYDNWGTRVFERN